jgi:hypothetical protein
MTVPTDTLLDGVSGFPLVEADTMPRPSTRAWGESALSRSSEKRLMVFSGTSNEELAKGIAQRLGIKLGDAIIKQFANGETYVKFDESVRGADVFLIQSPNGIG